MWVAKFVYSHDCILGNRCKKFKVSLQGVAFSVFKEKGRTITSSMFQASGEETDINQFFIDLKKDKNVIKLERKGHTFLLHEKAEKKAVKHYNPRIIFIKPVLINEKGEETWEISSWEKSEVSKFFYSVKREMKNFKLLKFVNIPLDNVFFPRLMPNLTEKQKHAIELAVYQGYYTSPRQIDLRKLAKLMKISLATYDQHLRAAEEKLIPNLLYYTK
ncbi:MAG: helix-turn-helix domain-containing protein [Candidatus Pacearchaeota archaeon]|nr:helix-turn-helix domain-containing protein [Candidatus Pacearchaeota archaeon]